MLSKLLHSRLSPSTILLIPLLRLTDAASHASNHASRGKITATQHATPLLIDATPSATPLQDYILPVAKLLRVVGLKFFRLEVFVLFYLVRQDALDNFKYFGVYLFGVLLDTLLIVIYWRWKEYLMHIGRR